MARAGSFSLFFPPFGLVLEASLGISLRILSFYVVSFSIRTRIILYCFYLYFLIIVHVLFLLFNSLSWE